MDRQQVPQQVDEVLIKQLQPEHQKEDNQIKLHYESIQQQYAKTLKKNKSLASKIKELEEIILSYEVSEEMATKLSDEKDHFHSHEKIQLEIVKQIKEDESQLKSKIKRQTSLGNDSNLRKWQQNEQLEEQLSRSQEENEKLKSENDKLQSDLQEQNKENQKLVEQINKSGIEEKNKQLQLDLDEQYSTIQDLQKANSELRSMVESFNLSVFQLENQLKKEEKQNEITKNIISTLNDYFGNQESANDPETQVKSLIEQIKALAHNNEIQMKQLAGEKMKQEQLIIDRDSNYKKQEIEHNQSILQIRELEEKLKEKENEIKNYENLKRKKKGGEFIYADKTASIRTYLKELRENYEKMKLDNAKDLEKFRDYMNKFQDKIEDERKSIPQKSNSSIDFSFIDSESQNIEKELKSLQSQNVDLNKQLLAYKVEIETLKKKLDEATSEFTQETAYFQRRIVAFENESIHSQKKIQTENSNLKLTIQKQSQEIQNLKDDLNNEKEKQKLTPLNKNDHQIIQQKNRINPIVSGLRNNKLNHVSSISFNTLTSQSTSDGTFKSLNLEDIFMKNERLSQFQEQQKNLIPNLDRSQQGLKVTQINNSEVILTNQAKDLLNNYHLNNQEKKNLRTFPNSYLGIQKLEIPYQNITPPLLDDKLLDSKQYFQSQEKKNKSSSNIYKLALPQERNLNKTNDQIKKKSKN